MQSLQETKVDVNIRARYRNKSGDDQHFSYCPTTDE